MKLIKCLVVIAIIGSHFSGYSQMYNFRNYSEDNGLSQSYIYNISQGNDGFISLSTGEGLSLFDGTTFNTFTTKELADNFVTTHYLDTRNIYWLGQSQNGVSYIKNGKFNALKSAGIKDFKVNQISEDKYGNIWIATNGGFFTVDTLFNLKQKHYRGINSVNSFRFDASGHIIAATPEGVYVLNTTTESISELEEFKGKNVKQIIPVNATKKSFWLSTESDGVYGIRSLDDTYFQFNHILTQLNSKNTNISAIYADRSNNLWISLFGEGLRKLTFSGNQYINYNISTLDGDNGLKNKYIQSIFQDFEGNMWFGTFGAGLIEKPIEKLTFYSDKDGLKNPDVKKIVIDKRGVMWVGNETGLGSFIPSRKSFRFFNSQTGFVTDKINALVFDSTGILWIGTNSKGLYTLNTATLKFETFPKLHELANLSVNTIIAGHNGNIMIGTNEGLYTYNQYSKTVKVTTTLNGLLHNNIINLFLDSKDRLWISSHGSPPYFLKDSKFTFFKDIDELRSFKINAVCEDKTGNIWIATEGDGVFKYDGKTFVNHRVSSGLLSNYCYGILTDNNNSIWVTHKNGLSEKKPFLKEFRGITENEGLLFVENNLNALYKDSVGDVWFGTITGLVHYNSEIQKQNRVEPKVSIVKVVIDKDTYNSKKRIEKIYGYYTVHIDFLGISFINPEKIKYKYRLIGIDSLWKITTSDFVDYPNLSDGEYVFQVMACNSEGLWSTSPAEVILKINEPVWKKIWFYVIITIFIVLLTYAIVYWRTQSLRKAQQLLQKKVREKTFLLQKEKEEAEKIKIELQHRNKDITDSISYAKRIQDSLLPPMEMLDELFDSNYFILYKPKDIVSGDFYWAASTTTSGDNPKQFSLAAVADCTGHGVPGAFLSIVACNFLKQSLTEESVNSPAEALDFLNANITANLNQSGTLKNRMRDGMDIALIGIDYTASKLYFSGANNPVYVYRKKVNAPQLIVLKPNKQAIGSVTDNTVNYNLQAFDLEKGDMVYLFSDGYADQFGGEKDKKFNYKRFKEILSIACTMPLPMQKKIMEEKFENWKGATEQTDDVCVMGIRF